MLPSFFGKLSPKIPNTDFSRQLSPNNVLHDICATVLLVLAIICMYMCIIAIGKVSLHAQDFGKCFATDL